MKMPKKRIESSRSIRYAHIPRAVRIINTAIAIVLCGIGLYHFTQPNQAWRSGVTELVAATLLLIAGYLISHVKAIIINLIVAIVILIAGIRHLIHGGGWRSGITELLFAVLLVMAATIIYIKIKDHNN
jgi:hypothetical protein